MRHVNETRRAVGRAVGFFYKTDDPGIVERHWTAKEEIHLDKLQDRIGAIQEELERIAEVEIPAGASQRLVEIALEQNEMTRNDRTDLQAELAEKQDLLSKVTE